VQSEQGGVRLAGHHPAIQRVTMMAFPVEDSPLELQVEAGGQLGEEGFILVQSHPPMGISRRLMNLGFCQLSLDQASCSRCPLQHQVRKAQLLCPL
jgi:hypothetical protein